MSPPGKNLGYAATVIFIAFAISLILGTAIIGYLWWPFSINPSIHFVVPADYDGPFVVVSESNPQSTSEFVAETELHVPHNGVLVVNDDSVLRRWHTTLVSATDGTIIRMTPSAASGNVAPNKVFLARDTIYTGKYRVHWYFIGSPGGDGNLQTIHEVEKVLQSLRIE